MVEWTPRALLVATALLGLGCQKADPHPPRLEVDCDATRCTVVPPAVGFTRPDGGTERDGGAEAGSGTVEGSVFAYRDETLGTVDLVTEPVVVSFEAPTGSVSVTSASGAYSATGLPTSGVLWARLEPDALSPWLPTVETVEPGLGLVDLVVAPVAVIDGILAFSSVATPRLATTGQVLVQFIDATGAAAGVSVDAHAGESVLYQLGDGWSDQLPETDATGFACIVNVSAATAFTTFSFTARGTLSSTSVRVVPGGVTVVGVPVQ